MATAWPLRRSRGRHPPRRGPLRPKPRAAEVARDARPVGGVSVRRMPSTIRPSICSARLRQFGSAVACPPPAAELTMWSSPATRPRGWSAAASWCWDATPPRWSLPLGPTISRRRDRRGSPRARSSGVDSGRTCLVDRVTIVGDAGRGRAGASSGRSDPFALRPPGSETLRSVGRSSPGASPTYPDEGTCRRQTRPVVPAPHVREKNNLNGKFRRHPRISSVDVRRNLAHC